MEHNENLNPRVSREIEKKDEVKSNEKGIERSAEGDTSRGQAQKDRLSSPAIDLISQPNAENDQSSSAE